jgi:YD repeat-containing protein
MDTVSIVSRDSFYADNPGAKRRRGARMQYWYTRDAAGNLIRIETERRIKSTRYHNTFYLRDGQLYCAEELIAEEAGNGEALSAWSASFVFEKSKLVALSSLGHGKSETDDWNPEAYVPHAFFWAVRSVVLHLQRTLRD